jgi:hypothetical protein
MSFADLELLRQGVRLEPLLQGICDFLDKQPALVDRVRRDLARGLKRPDHGRRGLTAAQVSRALVLMRLKNWDYRELRERIADRSRAAHRRMYEIQCMTTRQRQGAGSRQTTSYRALIEIAEAVVASARVALDDTAAVRGKDPLTALNIKALREGMDSQMAREGASWSRWIAGRCSLPSLAAPGLS